MTTKKKVAYVQALLGPLWAALKHRNIFHSFLPELRKRRSLLKNEHGHVGCERERITWMCTLGHGFWEEVHKENEWFVPRS